MTRPPPPLNFVRSFECAARHLSFTRAAEELGYTQAAISTHVRALEKYVGRALFVRKARSLELTEVGEAYLPTLRQALAQIDSATEAVVASSRERSVILSCPMSLAENWLPGCLSAFREVHPEIEVVVHGTIWDGVDDGIADVVITVNREDDRPSGAALMWRETLSLLMAPCLASRLGGPSDVLGLPRILISGRQEYWTIMGDVLGIAKFDAGHSIKTNGSNISLEMAARGLGVTVALTSLGAIHLERGLLKEPFAVRPESPWSYYFDTRRGAKNLATRAFVDYLRDYAAYRTGTAD
ncbi:Glycine cleavage system transcriptional activator [Defluviimonas aquaemixtae]|uniref:Glycine cleavage system transcriptional activator n=1 Tax=Albidovulum aquaemixtae TaxID=1542388 RepID=A0A2R8BIZ7_9RHOB|nr:LysR substrate-binding domain-containing protein [Defluviimonas aquaemixtae]SPH23332.1 Glycine cleavage system transcriptional activator [Defluviimonas aquaemixtae]